MKTGPYTLCHADKGSIQWWAWPAAALGLALLLSSGAFPNSSEAELMARGAWSLSVVMPVGWFACWIFSGARE